MVHAPWYTKKVSPPRMRDVATARRPHQTKERAKGKTCFASGDVINILRLTSRSIKAGKQILMPLDPIKTYM